MKLKTLEKRVEKEWKNILFNFLFIIISIGLVIFFHKNIFLTSGLLILVTLMGLLKWSSKLSIFVFVVFGFLFGVGELVVAGLGPWKYATGDLLTIPSWLFILWGNTALFIHQTTKELIKLGFKK